MHSEPRRKCDSALEFMAVLTNFGHGCISSDHGHDAFIEITERDSWFSRYVQQDIFGAPLATLFCHGTKLGQWPTIPVGDIGEVTQRVNAGEPGHSEVGLNVNATPMPSLNPQAV